MRHFGLDELGFIFQAQFNLHKVNPLEFELVILDL